MGFRIKVGFQFRVEKNQFSHKHIGRKCHFRGSGWEGSGIHYSLKI